MAPRRPSSLLLLLPAASVLLLLTGTAHAGRDYYDILDVPRDAHVSTIKKSYRRLARLYHPDKHPGDKKMEAKFKDISTAYEVLSDKKKRQTYDHLGEDGLKNGGNGGGGGPGGFGGGGFHFNPDDFGDMFGGFQFGGFDDGGGHQRFHRRQHQRHHQQQHQQHHYRQKVCNLAKVCENNRCAMVKECKS